MAIGKLVNERERVFSLIQIKTCTLEVGQIIKRKELVLSSSMRQE